MIELLQRIESAVTVSIERQQTARRRRRSMVVAGAGGITLLLTAGVGIAAVTGNLASAPTPIDKELNRQDDFGHKPGEPKIELSATDPGGLGWTSVTYVSRSGTVSSTTAPDDLAEPFPGSGGANGLVIADNLLNGPLVGLSVDLARYHGDDHYAIAGSVDGRVTRMAVQFGSAAAEAQLAPDTITVPVERPPDESVTDLGRRRLRRMPPEVTVRPYLVTFTPNALKKDEFAAPQMTMTLDDGSTRTQRAAQHCVSRSCGARFSPINDRDSSR
jgi:hypothetical protein